MKDVAIIILTVSAFLTGVRAATAEENAAVELGMTQATFEQGTLSINYCEKVVRHKEMAPMRIVLLWHGGSGKGDDNLKQLTTPSLRPLLSYLDAKRENAVVLVPQCPSSSQAWLSGGKRSPMQATRALVRAKASEYRVSSTNVFFAGISMGGTPAYTLMAQDVPNIFAKAIVCSGGGDTNVAASVTAEVRLFNGENDTIVDPAGARAMAEAINAAGGRAFFRLLPGHDHFTAADVAFSAAQWDWFFGSAWKGFVISIK
ncbi:MAG: hypothetical protein IJK04_11995 [Kiritimatiellae bacterium]|nr:hypothetical protein [Kiritimatiellia bacterium]